MKLYLKNMVSRSCILMVKSELDKLCVPYINVSLGEIEIDGTLTPELYQQTIQALQKSGFDVLLNNQKILTERIKNIIVEFVHYTEDDLKFNFSSYLSSKLKLHYTYLSNVFFKEQGISIKQYTIAQRVERVKELITYEELNLTEIAFKTNYSSIAHLSRQFKKTTGISPSNYKKLNDKMLIPIEQVGMA